MSSTFLTLLQDTEGVFNYLEVLKIIVPFLVGFSPTLFEYIKSKGRWGDERKVIIEQAGLYQTEAAENIAQAAGILLGQSQQLTEKNAKLIDKYEDALERKQEMYLEERKLREEQGEKLSEEIEKLKVQVKSLNNTVVLCSKEILDIIRDIQSGVPIDEKRLKDMERDWFLTSK